MIHRNGAIDEPHDDLGPPRGERHQFGKVNEIERRHGLRPKGTG